MSVNLHTPGAPFDRHSVMTRAAWAAGACCLLFAVGTGGGRPGTSAFASSSASLWAAPVDEVPACVSDSSSLDAQLSDARFVAQGWRWSPGSTAWIAVLVRVDVLKAVGLARIGGLYGPDVLIRPFGFLPIRTVAIV